MSEPQPYIGASVHYVSYGTPGGEFASEHRAAIVTALGVQGTGSQWVDLCVLNPSGIFFTVDVPFSAEGKPGTWHWPEAQEGQAAGPAAPPPDDEQPASQPLPIGGRLQITNTAGTTTTTASAGWVPGIWGGYSATAAPSWPYYPRCAHCGAQLQPQPHLG